MKKFVIFSSSIIIYGPLHSAKRSLFYKNFKVLVYRGLCTENRRPTAVKGGKRKIKVKRKVILWPF